MPVLEPGSDTEDLGEVEVTQLRTVNIPVKNVGNLSLQGQATIEGDPAFSVFPAYFNAAPGTEDGLVVTFAPTEVGDATAELVLTSNDPGYPDIRVYLSGSGVKADEGQDPGPAIVESTSGCGCESSPVGSAVPALATVVGALALARRRRA
jgi:MYXO-CTERM domain-containing protein